MDNNSLVYTTSDNKPELIMKVTGPNGEIKEIDGLKYHDADPNNPNDVSGFDITGKEHAYAIKKDQIIQAVGANQQTEQIWKVEVILVNFPDQDQYKNTGLTITGNVVITTEERKTYELAHINTITTLEPSDNSITATVELAKGATNDVEKYYFAIEEQDEVMTTAESEKTKDEVEGWVMEEGSTHTFNGLTPNTNYKIYSYVEDSKALNQAYMKHQ